jgi:transcriptional regulator with XRE-family HTH domain
MSKRSRIVMKTNEAEALRKLRELRSLSVRKAAERLGISHTLVNHLELGRANISRKYIHHFLKTFNFSEEEWTILMGGTTKNKKLENEVILRACIAKLEKLPDDKRRLIQSMLENL